MSRIRWIDRPPRIELKRWARLRRLHTEADGKPKPDEEHVVMLRNLSRSGVRLEIAHEAGAAFAGLGSRAEILLRIGKTPTSLAMEYVRTCEDGGPHADLAFRFVSRLLDDAEVLEVESILFPPPEAGLAKP